MRMQHSLPIETVLALLKPEGLYGALSARPTKVLTKILLSSN
jgi:hypothetical protein